MSEAFCCGDCHVYLPSLTSCPHCGSRNTIPVSEAGDVTLRTVESDDDTDCGACSSTGDCPECDGRGYDEGTCDCCGQQVEEECGVCEGTGMCNTCEGTGEAEED